MKTALILIIFAAACLISASGEVILACNDDDNSNRYKRGDTIVLCIHLIPNNTAYSPKRVPFRITVDKYSALTIAGVANNVANAQTWNGSKILVHAGHYATRMSEYLRVTNNTQTTNNGTIWFDAFQFFSVIISMENGEIKLVDWDNGCYLCGVSNCTTTIDIAYGTPNNTFRSQNCVTPQCMPGNGSNCDPKFYVSFVGTDANGNKMESAGLRLSAFRQYSLADAYGAAQDQFQKTRAELNATTSRLLTWLFGDDQKISNDQPSPSFLDEQTGGVN